MENKKIGALWSKKSKKGIDFMSGHVEIIDYQGEKHKIEMVLFKNNKTKENQPDWQIYLSEKQELQK